MLPFEFAIRNTTRHRSEEGEQRERERKKRGDEDEQKLININGYKRLFSNYLQLNTGYLFYWEFSSVIVFTCCDTRVYTISLPLCTECVQLDTRQNRHLYKPNTYLLYTIHFDVQNWPSPANNSTMKLITIYNTNLSMATNYAKKNNTMHTQTKIKLYIPAHFTCSTFNSFTLNRGAGTFIWFSL